MNKEKKDLPAICPYCGRLPEHCELFPCSSVVIAKRYPTTNLEATKTEPSASPERLPSGIPIILSFFSGLLFMAGVMMIKDVSTAAGGVMLSLVAFFVMCLLVYHANRSNR